jgi:hypothetical protein
MSAAERFRLGRVWSLWEIMHKFDGGKFQVYLTGLSNTAASMPQNQFNAMPLPLFDELKMSIDFLCVELTKLELSASSVTAQTLKDILYNEIEIKKGKDLDQTALTRASPETQWAIFSPYVFGKYRYSTYELIARVKDELSTRAVFAISLDMAEYLKVDIFGLEVFNAFSSANEDIAEAGMCLALDRGTACVMHLMRVIEVGLTALAKAVGVGKQNDWGSYLREIDKNLTAHIKAGGARSVEEQFYSEAASTIDSMKRAFRNPTMHPEKTYSPERAEEILIATRSFMRHLATRLKE